MSTELSESKISINSSECMEKKLRTDNTSAFVIPKKLQPRRDANLNLSPSQNLSETLSTKDQTKLFQLDLVREREHMNEKK